MNPNKLNLGFTNRRKRGESIQDYLERIMPTEEQRIIYWQELTKEMYKKNPATIENALDTLKDINPEAHEIISKTYLELQGEN